MNGQENVSFLFLLSIGSKNGYYSQAVRMQAITKIDAVKVILT